MTLQIVGMTETEAAEAQRGRDEGAGLGSMHTHRGNLPLETIDIQAAITGVIARTTLTQGFRNSFAEPLEATYVFPLPDRAAVTAMRMEADGRVVQAQLRERGAAREAYDAAIAHGQRAAIAEEERPDVFTMRVGNIVPGERVTVTLTMVGPLPYEDGEATYRLPLVVAPRYIPGTPRPGPAVGDGHAPDTDAVPDASRITPPVLLPGFPNPVRLSLDVDIDPSGLPLGPVRSSLHAVVTEGRRVSIRPGERVNRDFVLRLSYGEPDGTSHGLALTPDPEQGDATPGEAARGEGTFCLTVLPPTGSGPGRPRDLVLVLDRSGSMTGWKIVAARRAAARIVDTLTGEDRFAVLTFDNMVERAPTLPDGLVAATDRNRFRSVEWLAATTARGGTEMLAPLREGLRLLSTSDGGRDRVLVLVTDGQVGNEDQLLNRLGGALTGVRVHTVGIDQAVNAGFLGRLAAAGNGRCELVESEDRLDESMRRIHRRIGAPLVTGVTLAPIGFALVDDTVSPPGAPDLFPGAPLVMTGRYRDATFTPAGPGTAPAVTVTGTGPDGEAWTARVGGTTTADPAVTAIWARAHLRDLIDRYVAGTAYPEPADRGELERRIVATSLRFGVLCRFTAWLAVDVRVVTEGGTPHRVIQPVEPAAGWDMLAGEVEVMAQAVLLGFGGPPMAAMAPSGLAPSGLAPSGLAPSGPAGTGLASAGPVGGSVRARLTRLRHGAPAAKPARRSDGPPADSIEGAEAAAWAAAVERGELENARTQVATEARRLREAQGRPERERRALLADLGSRLAALLRHLAGVSAPDQLLEPLRPIAAELDRERAFEVPPPDLEDLWRRTLTALDTFTTTAAGPESGSTDGSTVADPAPRREFWKR